MVLFDVSLLTRNFQIKFQRMVLDLVLGGLREFSLNQLSNGWRNLR